MRELLLDAIFAGAFLIFALPALATKRRGWIAVVAILAFLYSLVLSMPLIWPAANLFGGNWNWTGKIFSITFMTLVAASLTRFGGFRRTDFGLTLAQSPGTGRATLFIIIPFLLLVTGLVWWMSPPGHLPHRETLWYQATLPGLDEELFFRGVMLGVFDRLFPGRCKILGAPVGYGLVATSVVFGLVHSVLITKHMHIAFYLVPGLFACAIGLVLAWARERTRSLLLPVLTHNAVNLLNFVVPVLH